MKRQNQSKRQKAKGKRQKAKGVRWFCPKSPVCHCDQVFAATAARLAVFAYAALQAGNPTIAAMLKKKRFMGTILVTFLVTSVLVLLVLNFTTGEEEIQHQIPRLYTTASPQFERFMGVLLGPSIQEGNEVKELLNGEQIFPPMLEAIRSAQHSITFETYIYWSGRCRPPFWTTGSRRLAA